MIRVTRYFYIVFLFLLSACDADSNELKFNNCKINLPMEFEEVSNGFANKEFLRQEDYRISIIQMDDIDPDLGKKLESDEFNVINRFEYGDTKFWVYDLSDISMKSKIRSITIEQQDVSLTIQSIEPNELKKLLENCFDISVIERLE